MKTQSILKTVFLAILLLFIFGCTETKTTDVQKVYRYWLGSSAPADMELMDGYFWESAHWSKEYIFYLKFKPSDEWWDAFIKQNKLTLDKEEWILPSNAPDWFQPPQSSVKYWQEQPFDQGSRYFRDTLTGICYIYKIQL